MPLSTNVVCNDQATYIEMLGRGGQVGRINIDPAAGTILNVVVCAYAPENEQEEMLRGAVRQAHDATGKKPPSAFKLMRERRDFFALTEPRKLEVILGFYDITVTFE